jgi:ferredoxin
MATKGSDVTRRQFMVVGSAAIAGTLAVNAVGPVSKAEAAAIKTTATGNQKTYYIGHGCMGCQVCRMKCPAGAIHFGDDRNEIDQSKCKHCGTCYEACLVSVVTAI